MFKLFAKKSLGQNFLVNEGVIARIVEAAEINSNDYILEIGPGTGNLTKKLAESAGTVMAIEKDRRAIDELQKTLPSNVKIVEADILTYKPELSKYKVVANLPYYITSHFLRVMLEEWPQPELAVLMVQKEVAQRMMAGPGEMNLLALSVQYYADVEKIMDVSPGSFRPMPSVDSTVIKIKPKTETTNHKEAELLFKLAKAAFAGKRKQLIVTLPSGMGLGREEAAAKMAAAGISPTARPETLSLADWLSLTKELQ